MRSPSRSFIFGTYTDQSAESGGVDVELTQYMLGGGYAWSLSDRADLYGKLGYTQRRGGVRRALGRSVERG